MAYLINLRVVGYHAMMMMMVHMFNHHFIRGVDDDPTMAHRRGQKTIHADLYVLVLYTPSRFYVLAKCVTKKTKFFLYDNE